MTTVYDHIKMNAGLIDHLPGRSVIMDTKITVEFSGNMQGLVEFLEATFKDPNSLTLNVTVNHSAKPSKSGHETLLDECVKSLNREFPLSPAAYQETLAAMPAILEHVKKDMRINAIKALRTTTNVGLKEAKDMVEGPISQYVNRGGV